MFELEEICGLQFSYNYISVLNRIVYRNNNFMPAMLLVDSRLNRQSIFKIFIKYDRMIYVVAKDTV